MLVKEINNQYIKEVTKFVHKLVAEMGEYVMDNYYNSFTNLSKKGWDTGVYIVISKGTKRNRTSRGGTKWVDNIYRPWIRINVVPYDTFYEYDHIKDDPVIGQKVCKNWKEIIALRVAHEVAHAVDCSFTSNTLAEICSLYDDEFSTKPVDGHGVSWQKVYRDLRATFVNGREFMCKDHYKAKRKHKYHSTTRIKHGRKYYDYWDGDKYIGTISSRSLCGSKYSRINWKGNWLKSTNKTVVESRKGLFALYEGLEIV